MSGTTESCRDADEVAGNAELSVRSRIGRVATSYVAVSIGVALLVAARLGVAPYDVLNTGLGEALHVPFGVAFLMTSAVFYGAGILLGGRTGWASLAGTAVIAPLVQVGLAVIPEPDEMTARVPMFVGGVLLLAVGVCLVISTELGSGPGEVLMLGLIARGMRVTRARWATDGLALVIGVGLGGALGLGTVLFAFAFAPLIAAGLRVLRYTPPVSVIDAVVAP